MSASSDPGGGPWETISGPSDVDALGEQLAAGAATLAGVEQLQDEHARPTKPGGRDAHANDPSQTTTIQRKYAQKLRGRFATIRAEIRRGVAERDVLAIADDDGEGTSLSDILAAGDAPDEVRERFVDLLADQQCDAARDLVEQLADDFDADDLVARDFEFDRLSRKHEAFMEWLRGQQEAGVLDIISREENTYVRSAYERGIKNANGWMEEDPIDADVATAIRRPIHRDRLALLYERNFEALQGITQEVSRQISRELAGGLAEGVHPDEMARRLTSRVDAIGRTRATTLARTEVMYSHNEATISQYERVLGEDTQVQVLAEISTSGDQHVCDICTPWDGRTLELNEARSDGPPFHPRCRCIVRPKTTSSGSSPAATTSTPTAS
jgi:SPP1 gp7 family putative phage head morphogenesis protein